MKDFNKYNIYAYITCCSILYYPILYLLIYTKSCSLKKKITPNKTLT